jgi:membrane protease YdiL (CAAX protease family)
VERPKATWNWWIPILIFLGSQIVAVIIATPFADLFPKGPGGDLILGFFGEAIPGLALWLWLSRRHKGWRPVIQFLPKSDWLRELGIGIAGGFGVFIGATLLSVPVQGILEQIAHKPVQGVDQLPPDITGLWVPLTILTTVVLAPVVEEFFFRGCVFRSFRARHRFALAGLFSALVFGLMHYLPGPGASWEDAFLRVPIMVFVGFSFAFIYERRGNLLASIGAHALFNSIGLLFILKVIR